MSDRRNGGATPHGSGAHLRAAVCIVHLGWNRRRGRSRCAGLWRGRHSDSKPGRNIQTSPKPVVDELPFAPLGVSRKAKVIRPRESCWPRTSGGRCATDWSPNSAISNPRTRPPTGSTRTSRPRTPGRRRCRNCRSQLPSVARHDRGRTVGRFVGAKQFGRRGFARTKRKPLTVARRPLRKRRSSGAARCGEDHRLRDKEHCKFVAMQPCVVCGRTPVRSASHSLRPTPGARTEGQRRIYGPCLPGPSSRPPWLRR